MDLQQMIDKSAIHIAEIILRDRFLTYNPEITQISRHILLINNHVSRDHTSRNKVMFICSEKKKDTFLESIAKYPQYMEQIYNLHKNELNHETDIRTVFRYFSKIRIRKTKFYYFLM